MIIIKARIFTKKEIEVEDKKYSVVLIEGVEYLDVKGLEQWLPWKKDNIRRLIRSGKIRGRKIKEKWFVSREDLYSFLNGSKRN